MKNTFLVFILVWLSLCTHAQTPTFHSLLFLDTDDVSLGNSILITEAQVTGFVEKVTKHSEMKSKVTLVKGKSLSTEMLDSTISQIKVGDKDIIFFYFAGHGWNNSESEFPMLKMGGEGVTEENSRGLQEIYLRLLEKKPRMTLVFAEACNGSKSFKQKITPGGEADHIIYNMSSNKVRQLFRQTKANILMSSSQRGQLSYSNSFGGYFSNTFYKTFEKMTAKEFLEEPTWEDILGEIQEGTRQLSKDKQNPIMNLEYYENQSIPLKKEGICAMNLTAFHKLYEDYNFLEKYWKDLLKYDKDKAVEIYEMFFQVEVPEFYENLIVKLNLNDDLPENEKKWFNSTAKETVEYLQQINKYKKDEAYRTKTFAKLSIPIDNLKLMHSKLDTYLKKCKE